MNGRHAPTSATQIKGAELNVHKETSQLNQQCHCEWAAINHKLIFNVEKRTPKNYQFHIHLSFPQLLINLVPHIKLHCLVKPGSLVITQNDRHAWMCNKKSYKGVGPGLQVMSEGCERSLKARARCWKTQTGLRCPQGPVKKVMTLKRAVRPPPLLLLF